MSVPTRRPENDQRNRGGIALFRAHGKDIKWVRGDDFFVPSRSRKTRIRHDVNLREMTCSCEDHTFGGHTCAHLVAGVIAQAKNLEAGRRKAEARANRDRATDRRMKPNVDFAANIERMKLA